MTDVTINIGGDDINVTVEGGSLQPSLQAVQDSAAAAAASAQEADQSADAAAASAVSAANSAALSGSGSAEEAAASAAQAAASAADAATSAGEAAASASEALGSANSAAGFAASSASSASSSNASALASLAHEDLAEAAAGAAQMAALTAGFYPGAQANVPRGLGAATVTGGSGYTDGTYTITTTGGSLTVQGSYRVVVSGGVIQQNPVVVDPGLYVGASPVAPTVSLASLGGGTGGAITASLDFLAPSGTYYWSDHASDTSLGQLYQNVAGVATSIAGETFVKSLLAAVVPVTTGGTATALTGTPLLPVVAGGVNQFFSGLAQAGNGAAITFAVAGVNGGAATEVLLPDGNPVPPLTLKTSYPYIMRWDSVITKYVLITPSFVPQQSFINLIPMSGSGPNALKGRIAHPNIKTPPDFSGVNFSITVDAASVFGSKSLQVYANDGVTSLFTGSIFTPEGVSAASLTNVWNAYDTVTLQRSSAGLVYIVRQPNPALTIIPPFSQANDIPYGLPVSVDRPVSMRQTGPNTYRVNVRPPNSYYASSDDWCADDLNSYTLFDMKNFQANVPNGCMALNSFFARLGFTDYAISNLQFTELQGNDTDTGLLPSTFETPFIAGNNADPVSGTNFEVRGIGHGYMSGTSVSLIGTLNGVDSANLYNNGITTQWTGDQLVCTTTGSITNTAGTAILADILYRWTLSPNAEYTNSFYGYYDWDQATVTPATTGVGTYAIPFPILNHNRIVGVLNGSRVTNAGGTNGVHEINLRDGSVTNIGVVDTVITWNDRAPDIQTVVVGVFGLGKSHKENGVAIDAIYPSFVLNNDYGPKLAGNPIRSLGTSKEVLSGIFEFGYAWRTYPRPPISY